MRSTRHRCPRLCFNSGRWKPLSATRYLDRPTREHGQISTFREEATLCYGCRVASAPFLGAISTLREANSPLLQVRDGANGQLINNFNSQRGELPSATVLILLQLAEASRWSVCERVSTELCLSSPFCC